MILITSVVLIMIIPVSIAIVIDLIMIAVIIIMTILVTIIMIVISIIIIIVIIIKIALIIVTTITGCNSSSSRPSFTTIIGITIPIITRVAITKRILTRNRHTFPLNHADNPIFSNL